MNQQKNEALSPVDAQLRDLGNTKINGVHWFAPNLITIYGLILYFIGFSVYLFYAVPGGVIALIGGLLDILDGMVARALKRRLKEPPDEWDDIQGVVSATVEEDGVTKRKVIGRRIRSYVAKLWIEITYPGMTHLGKVLDPHADKLKIIPTLIVFSALGVINPWLVAFVAVPEVIGTLMRRPLPLLKKWSHGQSATLVGKIKVYIQWASIATCVPIHQQLVQADLWNYIPNALLALSILFSLASVYSRWGKKKRGKKEVPNA